MKDVTSHCDQCDNPLGHKCERTEAGAMRARRNGLITKHWWSLGDERWSFFCNEKCAQKYLLKLCGYEDK